VAELARIDEQDFATPIAQFLVAGDPVRLYAFGENATGSA